MPQLVSNTTFDNQSMVEGTITGNGKYHAYISPELSSNNNKAVETVLKIHDIVPGQESAAGAIVVLMMERKDDAGNWHAAHGVYQPFYATSYAPDENGGIIPDQQISLGPSLFNFDGQVPIAASDGRNIVSLDSQKRGVMPSKFRFCVIVHARKFGTVGAFQSITISLDYELHAE